MIIAAGNRGQGHAVGVSLAHHPAQLELCNYSCPRLVVRRGRFMLLRKLLRTVDHGEDTDIGWGRTCKDMSLLKMN